MDKTVPILLLVVLILQNQVKLLQCADKSAISRQLHCSTEIRIRNNKVNDELQVINVKNPNGLDWFMVDEYVDLDRHRSSIQTRDLDSQRSYIYYNEVNIYGRNFILFEEDKNSCKPGAVYEWPLASLRSLSVRMLPIKKLTSDLCDIALGPSSLLLAISESLDKFRYVTKRFSDTRLTEVDVYERYLKANEQTSSKALLITLHVQSLGHESKPKVLSDIHGEIDVLSILVGEIDEKEGSNREKEVNSELEEYCYDEDEVQFYVDYYIVTRMRQTSLIGQPLDRTGEFDFHRDPFVHPIGLGCWYSSGSNREVANRFLAPSEQFSAIYLTNNGSPDPTYVAYSGYNNMLRIDNDGRKSIYELGKGLSYHVGEFKAMKEVTDSVNHGRNCIALEIKNERFSGRNMMERLLGVGSSTTGDNGGGAGSLAAPQYIGSKLIEQIAYEVYEMEITFGRQENSAYNLPILMESVGFLMPTSNMATNKSYFLTYYVTELANSQNLRSGPRQNKADGRLNDVVPIPKYIELWELTHKGSTSKSTRALINRLEFMEFSWALDVEPTGDPDARDLSRLFSIASCAQERSTQLEIRYPVRQTSDLFDREKVNAFQANKQLIKEIIHENMATQLDIPRINIAYVDVNFPSTKSADFFVESRIIELPHSITVDTLLGFAQISQILTSLKQSVISIRHNRHSLDDCKLDSLGEQTKNALMYCQGLSTCVLMKAEDASKYNQYQQKEQVDLLRSSDFSEALCGVHLLNWAQWTQAGIISRVYENQYKISSTLAIPFTFRTKNSMETLQFKGFASGYNKIVKSLDPVGFTGSLKSALVGYRHTLMQEDSKALNLNYAISLDGILRQEDQLKYCHFACQLDNYCESFSFCPRKKGSKGDSKTGCILSAMRLTREKIAHLDAEIKKVPAQESLQVVWSLTDASGELSSEADKRIYGFEFDQTCNLHSKDFLSAYKLQRSIQVEQVEHEDNKDDDDQQMMQFGLTLDECAASSHERAFAKGQLESSFTYCPLSAFCVTNQQSVAALDIKQTCYVYLKDATRFYHKRARSRLVIRLNEGPANESSKTSDNASQKPQTESSKMEKLKLGRIIEVASEQECARECNLRQANCLSFDSCLSKDGSFCMLYSIRSPSQVQRRLKYLPQEEQIYSAKPLGQVKMTLPTAFLAESMSCNHYALENLYLNIRLQQMTEQAFADDHQPSKGDQLQDMLLAKLNQSEQTRLNEEATRAREILDRLQADWLNSERIARAAHLSSSGVLIHLLLLLLATSVGCMATLYAPEFCTLFTNSYADCRAFLGTITARSSRIPQQLAMIVRSARAQGQARSPLVEPTSLDEIS